MEKIGVIATVEDADSYFSTMKKINDSVESFATESGTALKKSSDLIQDAAGKWRTASGQFATDAQKAAAGVESVAPAAKQAGDATKKAGADAEKGGSGFKAFGEIAIGALRQIGALAVTELGKAARAIVDFGKDSISLAGDFQANMLDFQSVAGKSVDTKGLEQFKDLFLQLGKELPVSTSDVQQAAIEMVKGGIDPAIVAAGGLRQNIQFAAAAMDGDLVSAANISAKILGGWAEAGATAAQKADFLTHATDQLTKAANASSVDVKELSLGIFNAQGIAKAAGVSFDDLTTTLAELAPRFASSSEAGTSLKNLIVRLNPTTKSAVGAMQSLGLYTEKTGSAFYDANGNFVGFQKASELLKTSLVGLTKEQQSMALQTIFGNDAMSAASALAELGSQGYTDMATALANANGVADAAALKQQGFNVALDNAKGSVEALQITIGTYLLPVLSELLNTVIAPAVNTITTFADAVFGSDDAFNALTPDMQALVTVIDAVVEGFDENGLLGALDQLIPGFEDWLPLIEGVAVALGSLLIIGTVASGIEALIASVAALGAAFTTAGGGIAGVVALLGGPVTLAVAGVALAIGALVVAWQNDWGGIQEKTAAAWDAVQPVLATLSTWLEEHIPVALKTASDFFNRYIFPVLSDLADIYIAGAILEIKAFAAIWENVLWPALKVVWSFIRDDLIPIIAALVDVNLALLQKAGEAIAGIWQKVLLPAITSVSNYISTNFGPTIKSIGEWMSSTFGPTLQSVTKWLGDVTGGFSGMGDAIQGTIKWLKDLASSISNLKLPDWATPGSPTPWEIALRGIGDALQMEVIPGVNSFGSALSGMGGAAATAASSVTNELGKALTGGKIVSDAKTLGKNAIAGLVSGMEGNMKAIDKVAGKVASKVQDAFAGSFDSNSPAGLTMPFGSSLVDGIVVGIQGALPGLSSLIDSMGATLIDQLKGKGTKITAQVSDMVLDIQAKIKDAMQSVSDFQIGALGSGADINRQRASNIAVLADLGVKAKTIAQQQLDEAAKIAATLNDPQQQADYFKARSDAILEMAKLEDTLNKQLTLSQRTGIEQSIARIKARMAETTNDLEKQSLQALLDAQQQRLSAPTMTPAQIDALQQQIALINAAQQQEGHAQTLSMGQGSASTDLATQLQALLSSRIDVGGQSADLPGSLENDIIRSLTNLLNRLSTTPAPTQQAAAFAGQGTAAQYVNNYNLGITTNQSTAVAQQSFATMQAMNP